MGLENAAGGIFQNRYLYGGGQVEMPDFANGQNCACCCHTHATNFAVKFYKSAAQTQRRIENNLQSILKTERDFYGRKNTMGGPMENRPPYLFGGEGYLLSSCSNIHSRSIIGFVPSTISLKLSLCGFEKIFRWRSFFITLIMFL